MLNFPGQNPEWGSDPSFTVLSFHYFVSLASPCSPLKFKFLISALDSDEFLPSLVQRVYHSFPGSLLTLLSDGLSSKDSWQQRHAPSPRVAPLFLFYLPARSRHFLPSHLSFVILSCRGNQRSFSGEGKPVFTDSSNACCLWLFGCTHLRPLEPHYFPRTARGFFLAPPPNSLEPRHSWDQRHPQWQRPILMFPPLLGEVINHDFLCKSAWMSEYLRRLRWLAMTSVLSNQSLGK